MQSVLIPLTDQELTAVRDRLGVYRLSTGERLDVKTEPVTRPQSTRRQEVAALEAAGRGLGSPVATCRGGR